MKLPRKDGLNIIPFIDIMLVLLAITLSTASFIAQGKIKVNLPAAAVSVPQNEPKKIQIGIDAADNFIFEGEIVEKEALRERIFACQNSDHIELSGDEKASFSAFVAILDILKAKNHENFAIKTKQEIASE